MKKILFALLMLTALSLVGTSYASSDATALSQRVMLTSPTPEGLIGTEWTGFFRDFRHDDHSFDLVVYFSLGKGGDVLAHYQFKGHEGEWVHGLARGNFTPDALVLADADPDPYFSYVFKHFGENILLGQIFTHDENGADVEVGVIYLEK